MKKQCDELMSIKKNDTRYIYCKEKAFPWMVEVFKGEHQLIVVPYITTIGYYYTSMAWYRTLDDSVSPDAIGKAVLDAFEHIRISPVDARTRAERNEDCFYLKETKCKSYKAFNKKYICSGVDMDEHGMYSVSTSVNSFDNNGYCDIEGDKPVTLSNTASAADIGNAVIDAFRICEEYKASKSLTRTHPLKPSCSQAKSLKFILPVTDIFPIAMTAERQSFTRVMDIFPKRVQIRQRNFTSALPPSLTVI